MFFSRKKPARSYDPATQQPALRCSICTGEQVAGFISPDGHFEDVQLIRTPQELDAFRARYSICLLYTSPSPRDRTRSAHSHASGTGRIPGTVQHPAGMPPEKDLLKGVRHAHCT